MADKTVSVVLEAKLTGFKAQMAQASATAKQTGASISGAFDGSAKSAVKFQDAYAKALDTRHIRAFDIAGAAMIGTLALASVKAASFEKSLSAVKAVTGATAAEMTSLRQAALEAGKDTIFSASEAADAETELAKAGIKTADILGGALTGALNLAAAGGLGLADAATTAAQAMNTFGLKGSDVTHIADVLAAGANKSAADVSDLSQAMAQSGLVARQTGLSFEDTVGVLSAFADRALIGSDAGTSLKTMLQRLTPQSKQAQDQFDELGISAYDAQGQFVGLDKFAGQLHDRMKDLTPQARNAALSVMFGSDAVRAATVLYELGAKGVDEYRQAVDDQGAAARMAATMTDNLAGDIERLNGSIETALIKGGTGANNVLRWMAQRADTAVGAFAAMPEPVIGAGFAIAGLSGAMLLLLPRIAATIEAAKTLNLTWGKLGKGLVGGAAVGVVLAVGASALSAKSDFDQLMTSVEDVDKALTLPAAQRSQALSAIAKQAQDARAEIEKQFNQGWDFSTLGSAWTTFTQGLGDAFSGDSWNPFSNMGVANDRRQQAEADMQQQVGRYKSMVQEVMFYLGQTQNEATSTVDAAYAAGVKFTDSFHGNALAVTDWARNTTAGNQSVQVSMAATANAAVSMSDTIAGALGLLDERGKKRVFQAAIDAATESLKKNKVTLDINTKAGRENQDALDAIAKAAIDLATTKDEEGNVIVTNTAAWKRGRTAYVDAAKAMGMSDAAAQRLADKIFNTKEKTDKLKESLDRLPKTVHTTVTADITSAMAKLQTLAAKLHEVTGMSYTVTPGGAGGVSRGGRGSSGRGLATGGYVAGPGSSTSDSIPAWLSSGEYVVKASSVSAYGKPLFDALNAQRLAGGGMVGPAAGASRLVDAGVTIGSVSVTVSGTNLTEAQIVAVVERGVVRGARASQRARRLVGM